VKEHRYAIEPLRIPIGIRIRGVKWLSHEAKKNPSAAALAILKFLGLRGMPVICLTLQQKNRTIPSSNLKQSLA